MKIVNKEYAKYKELLKERYELEMMSIEGIKIKEEDYDEEMEGYKYKSMYHNYSGILGAKITLNNAKLIKAAKKIGKSEEGLKEDIKKTQLKVVERLFREAEKIKLAER